MSELVGERWLHSNYEYAFDLGILATTSLAIVSIVAGASILIPTVDGFNPIYTQERVGYDGELFNIYKFQTMPPGTPDTPSQNGHSDSRRTRLGSRLSEKHFDEVPQAWNIVRREMSFVGPRPLIPEDEDTIFIMDELSPADANRWRTSRRKCLPGIVDQYSIDLHRSGYTLSPLERVESEILYSEIASAKVDMKIILESLGLDVLYKKNMGSETRGGRRGHKILAEVARGFGVNISPADEQYLRTVLRLAAACDELVDQKGYSDITTEVTAGINGKPFGFNDGMGESEAQELKEIFSELPQERQEAWLQCVDLPKYAHQRRGATNPGELIEVNMSEASMFAAMMYLPCEGFPDQTNRIEFNSWLDSISRVAYSVDSVVDMKNDFNNGLISIQPSVHSRIKLASAAIPEVVRAIHGLSTRNRAKLLGFVTVNTFESSRA